VKYISNAIEKLKGARTKKKLQKFILDNPEYFTKGAVERAKEYLDNRPLKKIGRYLRNLGSELYADLDKSEKYESLGIKMPLTLGFVYYQNGGGNDGDEGLEIVGGKQKDIPVRATAPPESETEVFDTIEREDEETETNAQETDKYAQVYKIFEDESGGNNGDEGLEIYGDDQKEEKNNYETVAKELNIPVELVERGEDITSKIKISDDEEESDEMGGGASALSESDEDITSKIIISDEGEGKRVPETKGKRKMREAFKKVPGKIKKYIGKTAAILEIPEGATFASTFTGAFQYGGAAYNIGRAGHELYESVFGETSGSVMPYAQAGLLALMGITAGVGYAWNKRSARIYKDALDLEEKIIDKLDKGEDINTAIAGMKVKKSVLKKLAKIRENSQLGNAINDYLSKSKKRKIKNRKTIFGRKKKGILPTAGEQGGTYVNR